MRLSERAINALDFDGVISCENAHAIAEEDVTRLLSIPEPPKE